MLHGIHVSQIQPTPMGGASTHCRRCLSGVDRWQVVARHGGVTAMLPRVRSRCTDPCHRHARSAGCVGVSSSLHTLAHLTGSAADNLATGHPAAR